MSDIKKFNTSNRTLSEPSTPPGRIRVVNEFNETRSLPNKFRDRIDNMEYFGDKIGVNDDIGSNNVLTQPRDGLELSETRKISSKSPQLTPQTGFTRSVTPRRYVGNRRVSAVHDEINNRRRRSSMVINDKGEPVYDPQYVGPITADYLRFLCKVVVQERQVHPVHQQEKEFVQHQKDHHIQQKTLTSMPGSVSNSHELVMIPKKRSYSEHIPKYEELDREISSKRITLATDDGVGINIFEKSLQLPSDTDILLKSPIQLSEKNEDNSQLETHTEFNNHFDKMDTFDNESKIKIDEIKPKPKTFSYLEKILNARKLKNIGSPGIASEVTTKVSPKSSDLDVSENPREHINNHDTSFVIRNEMPNAQEELNKTDNYDSIMVDTNINNNNKSEKADEDNNKRLEIEFPNINNNTNELQDFSEIGFAEVDFVEVDISNNGNIKNIKNDIEHQEVSENHGIPGDENSLLINGNIEDSLTLNNTAYPVEYQTPVNISDENIILSQKPTNLDDNLANSIENSAKLNEIHLSSGRSSPTGIIQEEYTLDHDDNEISFYLDNEIDDSDDHIDMPSSINTQQPRIGTPSSNAGLQPNNKSSFSINTIKKLVKSIQLMNAHNGIIGKNSKSRSKGFSKEIYEYIQNSSELFLQNIVSDLTAYSLHRTNGKSNQINVKDVLLLLNRINFAGHQNNSNTAVQDIMGLAQHFLPLELLISLDNNLNQYSTGTKNSSKNQTHVDNNNAHYDESNSDDTDYIA